MSLDISAIVDYYSFYRNVENDPVRNFQVTNNGIESYNNRM